MWAGVKGAEADPRRPFVLSSPSNGAETLAEGGISKDPASPRFGDLHYYDYAADAWNSALLPTPRCVTEFTLLSSHL